MANGIKTGLTLATGITDNKVFNDWIDGNLHADVAGNIAGGATAEIDAFFQPGSDTNQSVEPAPFFRADTNNKELQEWARGLSEDYSNIADRELFSHNLKQLCQGQAEVVITGQQPGFLGGPLYSLFKIATAVVAAKINTANGRPTVPIFWAGDDDDDLHEALSAVCWDPNNRRIFRHVSAASKTQPNTKRQMVGSLLASNWSAQAAQWLVSVKREDDEVSHDLSVMWQQAVAENWNWSLLQRRSLLRIFSGSGLIVVNARDAILHSRAANIYKQIFERRQELGQLVRERGILLAEHGYPAQINERSIINNLFVVQNDERQPLTAKSIEHGPGKVRPGVLFRSPIQDYLFRPAAVVVGPGELAYLRQLDPLYKTLDIKRSPLLPRLFGWLIPASFDPGLLQKFAVTKSNPSDIEMVANKFLEDSEAALANLLVEHTQVPQKRAAHLASERVARWKRGVTKMMLAEDKAQKVAGKPADPVWVFPDGKRQERTLAMVCALALWGQQLVDKTMAAAEKHLKSGADGNWIEYLIEVETPDSKE